MNDTNELPEQLRAMTAMIVDDDDFQIEFVADLLEDLGITKIIKAQGGKRGLAVYDAAKVKPALLICDIHMPGMDGFEFMGAMSTRHFAGGVILMSGQGSKVLHSASLVAQLSHENFLSTIEKPMQKDLLCKAILKML